MKQDLYDALPKFYVETTRDQVVDLKNQRAYQKKVGFKRVFTMDVSHSPFLSDPNGLAKNLIASASEINPEPDAETSEKQSIRSFYAAFASLDFERVASLLAAEIIWHQPGKSQYSGVHKGRKAVMELFSKFGNLSNGSLRLEVLQIMQNGPYVHVAIHYAAHRANVVLRGMGADVFKIKDGKIVEAWLYSDNQSVEDSFWSLK